MKAVAGRILLALALATWVGASTSLAVAAGNLAPNGNVEANPSTDYYTNGTGTFTWATDQSRSPTHALKLVSAQPSTSLGRWMTQVTRIPVAPGTTYTVSAWLKTANVTNNAVLAATFYTGSYLPSSVSTALTGTRDWTQLSVSATAPAGATHLRIEARLYGPGTIWVDDLSAISGSPPAADPPQNVTLPTIPEPGGQVGINVLRSTPGTWTGSEAISFAYQWQTCDIEVDPGDACSDLDGQTASTASIEAPACQDFYRVVVTASNSMGSATAASEWTIISAPLTNTAIPVISGAAVRGAALTSTYGTFTGFGRCIPGQILVSFDTVWQRCEGGLCTDIAGTEATVHYPASGASFPPLTYVATAADVGKSLRTKVTAREDNGEGTATAVSATTAPVANEAGAAPNLVPNADVEANPSTNYYTNGTAAFTWATDASHSPTRSLKIVSTQAAGVLTRWMTRTEKIPVNAGSSYAVSAWLKTATVSQANVTVTFWTGAFAYTGVTFSSNPLVGTKDWTELSLPAHAPSNAAYMRIELRLYGPGRVWSDDLRAVDASIPVQGPPELLETPTVSGPSGPRNTITASTGVWRNTPTEFHYQWRFCVYDVDFCEDLPGVTTATFNLGWFYDYEVLRVVVTAENAYGTTSIEIPQFEHGLSYNQPIPVVMELPTINGPTTVGSGVWISPGHLLGWAPPIHGADPYKVRWMRCTNAYATDCIPIPGADDAGPQYTIAAADVGFNLRAFIDWTNGASELRLVSPPTSVVTAP